MLSRTGQESNRYLVVFVNKKERSGSLPQSKTISFDSKSPHRIRCSSGGRAASCTSFRILQRKNLRIGKEERFGTLKNASITVEAALAFPLFFFAVLTMVAFLRGFGLYTEQLLALQVRAEEMAKAAAVSRVAEFDTTSLESAAIDLIDTVQVKTWYFPLSEAGVRVACRARVKPWIGSSGINKERASSTDGDEMVYLTENAEVVHTDASCTHLDLHIESVSSNSVAAMRNSSGSRYHACERCVGKGETHAVVYIGPDGDAYHNDPSCGFKRTVRLVKRSEHASLPVCSRCQQRTAAGLVN